MVNISATINPPYLANIQSKITDTQDNIDLVSAKVATVTTASELTRLQTLATDKITPQLTEFQTSVEGYFTDSLAQITSSLAVINTLKTIPTDLNEVIAWITTFISSNFSGPFTDITALNVAMLAQQVTVVGQIATLISSVASLQSQITSRASTLGLTL